MIGTCWTVESWNELPGDVWTMMSHRCFTPMRGVNGSVEQISEMQSIPLATNFEFEQM